ncbi:MAG: hypothetical protein LUD07_02665 [Clostridiales bacterium]|nr:hypothetical protein [Clostridiales bacterium]
MSGDNILIAFIFLLLGISVIPVLSDLRNGIIYYKWLHGEYKKKKNIIKIFEEKEKIITKDFDEYQTSKKSGEEKNSDKELQIRIRDLFRELLSEIYNYLTNLYNGQTVFRLSVKIVFTSGKEELDQIDTKRFVSIYESVSGGEEDINGSNIEFANSSSVNWFLFNGGEKFVVTDMDGYRKKEKYFDNDKLFIERYKTYIAFPLRCSKRKKKKTRSDSSNLLGILCIYASNPLKNFRKNKQMLDICQYAAKALSLSLERYYDLIVDDILQRKGNFNNGILSDSIDMCPEEKKIVVLGNDRESSDSEMIINEKQASKSEIERVPDKKTTEAIDSSLNIHKNKLKKWDTFMLDKVRQDECVSIDAIIPSEKDGVDYTAVWNYMPQVDVRDVRHRKSQDILLLYYLLLDEVDDNRKNLLISEMFKKLKSIDESDSVIRNTYDNQMYLSNEDQLRIRAMLTERAKYNENRTRSNMFCERGEKNQHKK